MQLQLQADNIFRKNESWLPTQTCTCKTPRTFQTIILSQTLSGVFPLVICMRFSSFTLASGRYQTLSRINVKFGDSSLIRERNDSPRRKSAIAMALIDRGTKGLSTLWYETVHYIPSIVSVASLKYLGHTTVQTRALAVYHLHQMDKRGVCVCLRFRVTFFKLDFFEVVNLLNKLCDEVVMSSEAFAVWYVELSPLTYYCIFGVISVKCINNNLVGDITNENSSGCGDLWFPEKSKRMIHRFVWFTYTHTYIG